MKKYFGYLNLKHIQKVLLVCSLFALFTGKADAYTFTWKGTGGSTAWELAANWTRTGSGGTSTWPGQTGTADIVNIGTTTYSGAATQPTLNTTITVASVTFGGNGANAMTLTINGVTLNAGSVTQNHNINILGGGITTTIADGASAGALICTTFTVGDSSTPLFTLGTYNTTINCNLSTLTVSGPDGSFTLNDMGSFLGSLALNNAVFNLNSGNLTVSDIETNDYGYAGACTFKMDIGSASNTLTLLGAAPLAFLLASTNNIYFVTAGGTVSQSTVIYGATSGTQTVYTTSVASADGINTSPTMYPNLTFQGASQKNVSGAALLTVGGNWITGGGTVNLNTNIVTITVTGNWNNTALVTGCSNTANATVNGTFSNSGTINVNKENMTFTGAATNTGTYNGGTGTSTFNGTYSNSAGGAFTAGTGGVYFNSDYTNSGTFTANATGYVYFNGSAAQSLTDNSAAGTKFNNVSFSGTSLSNPKTMSGSGGFAVSATGVLYMVGSTTKLDAGGVLTLMSGSTSSATVAAITSGSTIINNVNVQRYITGGAGYRGYRLISSPVYSATVSSNNVFSVNYLQNSVWLTGSSGGGFDKTGNPTLYLYREDQIPSNATFISGNFEGISAINNSPTYNYSVTGSGTSGTFNLPVGNGVMFFFRGNKASAAVGVETVPGYTPVTVTTTTTGTLNQGQVIVHDWYTPASANLGYTGSGTSTTTTNYAVRGFNLVGNPYASSIDWEQYNTSTTTTGIYANNVGNTIYELNPATNNYDSYQVGGAHTNHGTRTIVSGQGFFVQVANGTNPQLIFNESAKTNTQNTGLNLFMATRGDMAALNSTTPDPHLRLQMAKDSVNTDDMYIGFNSAASSQYVFNEDAPYKTGNGKVKMASFSSDNVKLAINKMPLPGTKQATIPLFVNATAYGEYKLNMTELEAIPQLYDVWLIDRFNKDSLDMRHNTTYTFDITADTNSYGCKRFQLVIRQNPALGVHLLSFTAKKATSGAQVVWTTENEQNYTNFTVERSSDGGVTFDVVNGFASNATGTYSSLDKTPPAGSDQYRLKLRDLNGATTYSNVVTLVYGNGTNAIAGNISVYPNPASSMINLAINQSNGTSVSGPVVLTTGAMTRNLNQSSPSQSYNIKIINITGAIIMSATTSSPTWQDNVSNLTPGTYIIQVFNNTDKSLAGKNTFVKM